MKKFLSKVLSVALIGILLVSCGKDDTYEEAMLKAKDAIIEQKFEKADAYIEMALESKPKENEAKNYQKQIKSYIEALDFVEKDEIENAIMTFDEVIEVKDGSDKLVEYAKKEKAELEDKKDSSEEEKSEEKSEEKEESSENEKEEGTIWNSSKASSLKTFMEEFSAAMNQDYKEYGPTNDVDMYGLKLPSSVLKGECKMVVDKDPVEVEWSETGEGKSSYQLVDVYSDATLQKYSKTHVYFFVIEDGNPKVYITEQTQGNPENYLYFNETINEQLENGFEQIVKTGVAPAIE